MNKLLNTYEVSNILSKELDSRVVIINDPRNSTDVVHFVQYANAILKVVSKSKNIKIEEFLYFPEQSFMIFWPQKNYEQFPFFDTDNKDELMEVYEKLNSSKLIVTYSDRVVDYYKRLGSLEVDEYRRAIQEPVYDIVKLDKDYRDIFNLLYGSDTDIRKAWMSTGKIPRDEDGNIE